MILKKVETSIKTYNINKKMNIAGSRGRILFLFFSSIWAGRIPKSSNLIGWSNHAHVTGPAFYDTVHGPDFFPTA